MGKKRNNMDGNEAQAGNVNTDIYSSHNTEEEEEIHDRPNNNDQKSKKRGRGATKFKTPRSGEQPKVVQHNEYGQRIGDESKDLSTYLGTLTREFVPYTLEEWADVDEDIKDKMWYCIKMKFIVEEWERKAIFQHLNKLWRDRKSKLQVLIRTSYKRNRNRKQNNLSRLKPDFMTQKQWDLFVTRTLSPEFQAKAAHFIQMKAMQTHNHTMGREGYARLEDRMKKENTSGTKVTRVQVWLEGNKKKKKEPSDTAAKKMKEVLECPIESQNTTNINEDALSLVFGKEARGRVRGMGFGIAPSKVGAQVQGNAIVNQLQGQVRSLTHDLDDVKAMVAQLLRQQNQNVQAASDGAVNSVGNDVSSGDVNVATSQSNKNNVPNREIRENTKCKLLHSSMDGVVVAEGRIASTDPNAKVHHVPLGKAYWKVWVDKVIVEDVELFRPNDEMFLLEHARGSTVAWLPKYIVLDE